MSLRKRLGSLMLFAVLVTPTLAAASPEYGLTVSNIELREVLVDDLIQAEMPEDVEFLLYPTGMELPTKYLDFFSFFDPFEHSVVCSKEVASYLNAAYPEAGGVFTLAEVKAMELYLGLLHAALDGTRSPHEIDMWEAFTFIKDNEVTLTGATPTTVAVQDMERFRGQLVAHQMILNYGQLDTADPATNYSEYQDLITVPVDGSPLMGFGWNSQYDNWYCWLTPEDSRLSADTEYDADVATRVAAFWQTRSKYMEQLGVSFVDASAPIKFVESVDPSDMWRMVYLDNTSLLVPALSVQEWRPSTQEVSQETVTPPATTAPVESVKPTPMPESVPPSFKPQEQDYNDYVTEFNPGQQSNGSTMASRTYGWKDVLLVISIIIVVIASLTLFIMDAIRKKRDPMRTFRWKRR